MRYKSYSSSYFSSSSSVSSQSSSPSIAVIGGGASGIFAAAAAAEANPEARVVVLEATSKTLTKVAISGGGRCNVLHDTTKPVSDLLAQYPRGHKELTGVLTSRFSPSHMYDWFTSRGVSLKTEQDGRMFPTTDSSQTIVNVLLEQLQRHGVELYTKRAVQNVTHDESSGGAFVVDLSSRSSSLLQQPASSSSFDAVILATGSSPSGRRLAQTLGLSLVPPVPSLFTLTTTGGSSSTSTSTGSTDHGLLYGLAGLSVPWARLTLRVAVPGKKKPKLLQQEGPLLITHHGISGPATLRLSAFGARDFHKVRYETNVTVHWAPSLGTAQDVAEALWKMTTTSPKRAVATSCPLMLETGTDDSSASTSISVRSSATKTTTTATTAIPRRLWASFCNHVGFSKDTTWNEAPKKQVRALAHMVSDCTLPVTGKGVFKEEFVTAGGVSLKDVDMRTMESKSCPGLFVCGEVMDVDGVTGGFNFMNCWSTGHVAGTSAAKYVRELASEDSPEEL